MTIIFLQNIFEKSINGEWGNEDSGKGEATAVIRTSNFLNSGRLNLDNIVCREIDKDKNSDKILRTGDIIIEKSGGSPNQPVGRVVYFDVTDQDYFTNNFTSILRVKPEYNSKYIFYLMKYLYDTKKVLKFQNQTTGIINLKLADYLNKTKVNIETIENQNTIVDILDRLEYQIINRNKQISELSNLVKSRFNEMFGSKKFDKVSISELVDDRIETAKKIFDQHDTIKYIDISSIDNKNYKMTGFQEYMLNQAPSRAQQHIRKGDIVVSTVRPNLKNIAITELDDENLVASSGFCVLRALKCLPEYLFAIICSDRFTNKMTNIVTGANYPAIKSSDIMNYIVPLPPIQLQNEFAEFVAQVDKSQFACGIVIKLWRNSLKSSII